VSETVKRRLRLEDWEKFVFVGDPQISPDGNWVAYTRSAFENPVNERRLTTIRLVRSSGQDDQLLATGSSPRWSPDGTRLLYLSDAPDGSTQIFVRDVNGGRVRQLTTGGQAPDFPAWSPDGARIAYRTRVVEPDSWTLPIAPARRGVVRTPEALVIDDLHYRRAGDGFLERGWDHLFVVGSEGGEPRQVTSGRWDVGAREAGRNDFSQGFSWTPDGREIVFDGLITEEPDRQYLESHIYRVEVETGQVRLVSPTPEGETGYWMWPVVSPDGRMVAYSGYSWTERHAHAPTELWVANLDGSNARRVSEGVDEHAHGVRWSGDGTELLFQADYRGTSPLYRTTLDGQVRRFELGDEQSISLDSVSRSGVAAGTRTTYARPAEVVTFPVDDPASFQQLTNANPWLDEIELGAVEPYWAESRDGTSVQAWAYLPPGFEPAKRYPLVVFVHGGPHYMGTGLWDGWTANFLNHHYAAEGYVVAYPNYRGSTGYGTEFGNTLLDGHPNQGILDDLLASADALIERGFIDPERLFLVGESAGGVISAWVIGNTSRFRAAAVYWPITNWVSDITTDESLWAFRRFEHPFWEDPTVWLESSPIMHTGKVVTPALFACGEHDLRTPINETEQFFNALKLANRAPTRMLRLHESGHGYPGDLGNLWRLQSYTVDWFRRWDPRPDAG
jgi:dipeptidyl aminopeptidase/acylaminoacyl peptidase